MSRLRITREDLDWAVSHGLVGEQQATSLWLALSRRQPLGSAWWALLGLPGNFGIGAQSQGSPERLPDIAYKYTSAQFLSSIVRDGALAFPSVDRLNDPYESSFAAISESLTREEVRRGPVFVDERPLLKGQGLLKNMVLENDAADVNLEARIKREAEAIKAENAKIVKRNALRATARLALDGARREIGVLALTRRRSHDLLWAHYGHNSQGICVGIALDHPRVAAYLPRDSTWRARPTLFRPRHVVYSTRMPGSEFEDVEKALSSAFFSKFMAWGHEQEVRILRPIAESDSSVEGVAIFHLSSDAVKEVLIGPAAGKETRAEAAQLAAAHPRIKFFTVRAEDFSYRLEIEPLLRGSP